MAALGGLIAGASLVGAQPVAPDNSAHLVLVPDSARAEAALARSNARTVARYDSFTLVEARGDDEASLRAAGGDRRDDMRKVSLPGGSFDPLGARESLAAKGASEPNEVLALVQFNGPVKDEWLARLADSGARIVQYLPQNAYLVHASGEDVDALAGLVGTDPAIRAVTRVTGADKQGEGLPAGGATRPVAIQTLAGAAGADARRAVAAGGAQARADSSVGGLTTQFVSLSGAEIDALATDPAVVSVTPYSTPKPLDERSAQIVAGNLPPASQPWQPGYLSWLATRGFGTGTFNFAIDVTDGGLDTGSEVAPGHPDFYENGVKTGTSRVQYINDWTGDDSGRFDGRDCRGHGTNVASIAAGYGGADGDTRYEDQEGFQYGTGAAPRAKIGASKIFDCAGRYGLSAPDGFIGLTADAYANEARISNNSWGNEDLGVYSAYSQDFDSLVRDAQPGVPGNQQMVEVVAAGNDGDSWGSIASPGTAKNVITVGASESVRPLGDITCGIDDGGADDEGDIAEFSSRGPTDDGRLKPDVVAPGTRVVGAAPQIADQYNGFGVCEPFFPGTNVFYSLESGTSQATPAVSGAAALIRDWSTRVRGAVPSPALTKAILVNTATDLIGGNNGQGDRTGPAPSADQGWGRPNLKEALDTTGRQYVDQTEVLAGSGSRFARAYDVQSQSRPLKVTLAWTDPPGAVGTAAFVNDLDLVVSQGGRTYRGNVIAGGRSVAGGEADTRNNLESVVLPGAAGRFSVEVKGTSISGDGVPGNGDTTDQDFALVVSNAQSPGPAPMLTSDRITIRDSGPADNDSFLEPAEPFALDVSLHNSGDAQAEDVSGTIGGNRLTFGQPAGTWGDISADGSATAAPPFAGTLDASAPCGADLPATLSLNVGGSPQTVPVTLPTGEPGVPAASPTGPSRSIPDNASAGVESKVTVDAPGLIKDLDVTVPSLVHPHVGDLAIELTSPSGTTVTLARHPGGPDNSGSNFSQTVFDDEAPTNISKASAPYSGRFRPQNDQLSRFDGEQRKGTWTLRVRDLGAGGTGSLMSWHTTIQRAICDFTDRVAPDTSITGGPPGITNSRGATFRFGANESGSIFECSLDGGAFMPCASVYTLAALVDGTHTLRARARDLADNVDPSPAARSWTVDGSPPVVTLTTPRAGVALDDSRPRLAGRAGAAPGDARNVTVRLWRGTRASGAPAQSLSVARDPASGAWSTRPGTLGDGGWTARVEQTDAAGNTGVSPPVSFIIDTQREDDTGPNFALAPVQSDLADARANRLTVLAGCGTACRVTAELRRGRGVLGRAAVNLRAQSSKAIKVRLTRRGRAALRGVSTFRAKLRVRVKATTGSLTLNKSIRLREIDMRRAGRFGLPFAGTCSESGSVTASLTRGGVPVAVASGKLTNSSSTLRLRLRKSSLKRLLRARRAKLTVKATVSAPTGPAHSVSYRLTLRR